MTFRLISLALWLPLVCAQGQTLYSSGTPTDDQQYMLELINRARANGIGEALRLGLSGLEEGPPSLAGERWTIQNAVQPLSWNPLLANAAQTQANRLNNADQFFLGGSPHTFGGMTPQQRIAAAGYTMATYSGTTTSSGFFPGPENVSEAISRGLGGYTGARLTASVLSAHNGLFADLSVPGRGHRDTLMLGFFREVGIGVSVGSDVGSGTTWDSVYLVQDFGAQPNSHPFVTGVVYHDVNHDGFYNPGEGLAGVSVNIPGASYYAVTSSSGGYSIPVPGNGTYNVSFSGASFSSAQRTATIANGLNAKVDSVVTASLGNISTRVNVGTGDDVLIGGFIVTGRERKSVLIRALGPTLTGAEISNVLLDPVLELHDGSGAVIAVNDNWVAGANAQTIPVKLRPPNNTESAILTSLAPGNYTAIVRGVNNGTGIALMEVYDLDVTATSKLANVSTRGLVQVGDEVMIAGFIVNSPDNQSVLVRVLGPGLTRFNIAGLLNNPTLELRDGNGALVSSNDNWKSTQQSEIVATGYAPGNDLEPAITRTLAPGNYTAVVRGVNGSSGIALVEVYGLN